MQTGLYSAHEESFVVKDGTTILVTSPLFSTDDLQVIEYCFAASSNGLYTLELRDLYGDSWDDGSYLKIENIYGNVVFKAFMVASSLETYTISLNLPIAKVATWKMISATASDTWNQYTTSETGWYETVAGNIIVSVAGTQYLRKTFMGVAGMAAYEVQIKYRYGIVAYINGMEIYRDNVGDGVVNSTSLSTGSYSTVSFHGFIRPGDEIKDTNLVLAVELHFMTATEPSSFDFDAYLATMMSSVLNGNCYVYGYDTTVSANNGVDGHMSFDWHKSEYYYSGLMTTSVISYTMNGPTPYINGLRIWPDTADMYQPKVFTWAGSNTVSGAYTTIISKTDASYSSQTFEMFNGHFHANLFKYYRASVVEVAFWDLNLYEMQPMICSVAKPTSILFPGPYVFYAKYDPITIKPVVDEFTSCSVTNLPAGLTINALTCTVTGGIMTAMAATSFVMTSVVAGITYTGSFSLEIIDCTGTGVEVLRVYKIASQGESFSIKDSITNEVVLSVPVESTQKDDTTISKFLCLTGTTYTATVGGIYTYWEANSFVFINIKLSDDESETIARLSYDSFLGNPSEVVFNVRYEIPTFSQWKYMMSTVPASWTDSTVTGWSEGTHGTFTAPTNQIQLFKKIFDVTSIVDAAGFVISIQYKYGCAIYLNGIEVFTNGVTTPITATSTALTVYDDILFRQISLPIKTMAIGTTAAVEYLHQGSNTLAIALVAITSTQTTVDFDCALRLMRTTKESRSHDVTITKDKISGSFGSVLSQTSRSNIFSNTCDENYLDVKFNKDRREWISSVNVKLYYIQYDQQPHSFIILTRNSNSEEWTSLKIITGLSWSLTGQSKRIWLENNKPWNQYRFKNFATGSTSQCKWKLGSIDLLSDCTTVTIPEFTYPAVTIVYRNIEMGEIYPTSDLYSNFLVDKPLPTGLNLDPTTGVISGTAPEMSPVTSYIITAKKFTGGDVSFTISLGVEICFGGKNLITLVARTDSYPQQSSYKLYKGKGVDGQIERKVDRFNIASALNYGDFCIAHGIYTIQLIDSNVNGWSNPAGYYLTVDLGTMIFEMGQVPRGTVAPVLVTTMFSSFLPFQINFDNWKVWSEDSTVDAAWKEVTYDDAAWRNVLAADIGNSQANTVYIRKAINIPSIDDYQVLNIRMKFVGGVAVYFNGRIVARFNLPETFDSSTSGIKSHDYSVFERFHVILTTAGGVTGANMIAFEIHRTAGEPTSSSVIFDATGVFGVNDCSIAVDSFTEITGSKLSSGTFEDLFDLSPVTYGYLPNAVKSFVEWTVTNLEGSKFNSFGMQTPYERTGYGFSVYGRRIDEGATEKADYTSILAEINQSVGDMKRNKWDVPVGIAGFHQFKLEVDKSASSTVYVSSYMTLYCKASGNFCPAVEDFPAVGEGQISPGSCPYGYKGYSHRKCVNGVLGEIKNDNCVYKAPSSLKYESPRYTLIMDIPAHINKPMYQNIITKFSLLENTFLPTGLILNSETGEITGTPTSTSVIQSYTIYGSNPRGTTPVVVNISIRKGECKAEGSFEKTEVGNIAVFECSLNGNYIGTQKRPCILGALDGEWQKASGVCMSVGLIAAAVIIVIIIIIAIAIIAIRSSRKAKAVGGVKGKSKVSNKKSIEKKSSAKTVKV